MPEIKPSDQDGERSASDIFIGFVKHNFHIQSLQTCIGAIFFWVQSHSPHLHPCIHPWKHHKQWTSRLRHPTDLRFNTHQLSVIINHINIFNMSRTCYWKKFINEHLIRSAWYYVNQNLPTIHVANTVRLYYLETSQMSLATPSPVTPEQVTILLWQIHAGHSIMFLHNHDHALIVLNEKPIQLGDRPPTQMA